MAYTADSSPSRSDCSVSKESKFSTLNVRQYRTALRHDKSKFGWLLFRTQHEGRFSLIWMVVTRPTRSRSATPNQVGTWTCNSTKNLPEHYKRVVSQLSSFSFWHLWKIDPRLIPSTRKAPAQHPKFQRELCSASELVSFIIALSAN